MVTSKERQRSFTQRQDFLTRLPFVREKYPFALTSAWLYTALLGNGRILACLDETGEVRQLFYPHIDAGPHVRLLLTGIQVREGDEFPNRLTSPVANLYWLTDEAWEHQLEHVKQAAVVRIISQHSTAGLRVERMIAVDPEQDLLTIQVRIKNLRKTSLRCQLISYAGFDFDQRSTNNCCFFDGDRSTLTFFSADRYIQLICDAPVDRYMCTQLTDQKPNQLLADIGQDHWEENEYAIGQVSGAVRYELGNIEADASVVQHLSFCFGCSLDEVNDLSTQVRSKPFNFPNCVSWWKTRFSSSIVSLDHPEAQSLYERSLITLHLLTDAQTGGMIAGPECDPSFRLCGGYGMCWPRDGAYCAHALDRVGQYQYARTFYNWALGTQERDGSWCQRYDVKGRLSSTWGRQFDETGTVVWAICRHIQLTNDLHYGHNIFPQLVKACLYMQRSLDPVTGLAPLTKDLWEERDSLNTYACAATWGAFHEISLLAGRLADNDAARHWAQAALQLKAAIEKHLWSEQAGHFLRGLNLFVSSSSPNQTDQSLREVKMNGKTRSVQLQDSVLDISLLGLSVPFGVFSPEDPRMQATAEAIAQHLASPIGGIFRYQNDTYRGGNPWILCTLWLAWFDALAGETLHPSREYHTSRARELYTWVLEHRTALDLLAEQINCTNGQPCWIVPLAWSHAMFLLVSAVLEQTKK